MSEPAKALEQLDEVTRCAFERWRMRHDRDGRTVTLLDLYRSVADARGVEARELPAEDRRMLSRLAMRELWPGFEVTDARRRAEPIELVAYDPGWPAKFEIWRARLAQVLRPAAPRIEHVGSTSVPGLVAKPVVDIQMSVEHPEQEDDYVPALARVGLELRSRDSLHRFLCPPADRPREVHVHVCRMGSEWEREHVLFRDYLRRHPAAATRYAETKLALAREWSDDRAAYTEAKTSVVLETLQAAERWASETSWSG